ncbi:ATPase domain-containing protein [Stetteria hydrogenophila]
MGEVRVLRLECEWLARLLPDGFPYPTSTLISGPGGSGKPLVGLAFVSQWVKSGGSAVFALLQYEPDYIRSVMRRVYGVNLDDYRGRSAFIAFDAGIDGYRVEGGVVRANLLKPAAWDAAIAEAESMLEDRGIGVMVFSSSLNLLLFSPSYRDAVLSYIEDVLASDKSRSYLFTVNTNAFKEDIKRWEDAADNLMYSRMEKPARLLLRIERMKGVRFSREEVEVPLTKEAIEEIKKLADESRKRIIQQIMKI